MSESTDKAHTTRAEGVDASRNGALRPPGPASHEPSGGADEHEGHGVHDEHPFLAHHFDSPEHQFQSGKLGIWIFLVTEVLFFAGLFCAYSIYRGQHPEIFYWAHFYLDTQLGAINTIVLIVSSLSAAWAVRNAQLNQQKLLVANIAITIACALTFMGVKYVEYSHKFHDGLLWGGRQAADGTPPQFRFDPHHPVWEVPKFEHHHPAAAAAAARLYAAAHPTAGHPEHAAGGVTPPTTPAGNASAVGATASGAPPSPVSPDPVGAASAAASGAAPSQPLAGGAASALAPAGGTPPSSAAASSAGVSAASSAPSSSAVAASAAPSGAAPSAVVASGPAGRPPVAAASSAGKPSSGERAVPAASAAPPSPEPGAVEVTDAEAAAAIAALAELAAADPPTPAPAPAAAQTVATPAAASAKPEDPLSGLSDEEALPLVRAGVIGPRAVTPSIPSYPKNAHVFFGIYFFMTGLHGLHVLGGIVAWLWLLRRAVRGEFGPKYFGPVDFVALYWHLVDLVWIYLFPLLYLIH